MCTNCQWKCKYRIGCHEYENPRTRVKYVLRYQNADNHRFWLCTEQTYISTKSLLRALNEQYHAHSGVSTITDAWNNFHNNKVKPKRGWIIEVSVEFECNYPT